MPSTAPQPAKSSSTASSPRVYVETFDTDTGGWYGWGDNFQGAKPMLREAGAIGSRAPWWVDYNHAPPGAGYLQLLTGLYTRGPFGDAMMEIGGPNRFVQGGFPTDFTNARVTVRHRGEIELRGAQPRLLIQGSHGGTCSGWVLMDQPLKVTPEWTEQTLHLTPEPSRWTPLGSRHDRTDTYGVVDLPTVLAGVNVNIYFVMFPVTPVPMGPLAGDPHKLRAGRDYPIWGSKLPDGYVWFDTVKIEFSAS